MIDYPWSYHDEYSHYTAVGECVTPPSFVLPYQRFTVGLKVYNVWAEFPKGVAGETTWTYAWKE